MVAECAALVNDGVSGAAQALTGQQGTLLAVVRCRCRGWLL